MGPASPASTRLQHHHTTTRSPNIKFLVSLKCESGIYPRIMWPLTIISANVRGHAVLTIISQWSDWSGVYLEIERKYLDNINSTHFSWNPLIHSLWENITKNTATSPSNLRTHNFTHKHWNKQIFPGKIRFFLFFYTRQLWTSYE